MKKRKILLTMTLLSVISIQTLGVLANSNESPLFKFGTKIPILLDGEQIMVPNEFNHPKEQFRTAWVATVSNLDFLSGKEIIDATWLEENEENYFKTIENSIGDFPSIESKADKNITKEEFVKDYNKILNRFEELNLNTMTFQVRPMLDAFYPSEINPWSEYLTGKQGKEPNFGEWDPLKWAIEETHKRGMQFHAWFNPYRVTNNTKDERSKEEKLADLAENNFARNNSHLVYEFQNKLYLDPGRPEVVEHIKATVKEVLDKYDIDAVHFDDYFYPYKYTKKLDDGTSVEVTFHDESPDLETFDNPEYNRGFDDIKKWRTDNVNLLIREIKKLITEHNNKTLNSVQWGVSPFGIWGHAAETGGIGSDTPVSSTASVRDYVDTRTWVKEGWIDYLTPQIYWAFAQKAAPYGELADWWSQQFKGLDKTHLYLGLANYKHINNSWDSDWTNPQEIGTQLRFNQKYNEIKGVGLFSYKDIVKSIVQIPGDKYDIKNQHIDILENEYFNMPSNAPEKKWLDNVETNKISNLTVKKEDMAVKIKWEDNNKDSRFYMVYRVDGIVDSIDIKNPNNILKRFGKELGCEFIDEATEGDKEYTYAITVIDKAGIETEPVVVQVRNIIEIKPQKVQNLKGESTNNTVTLTWDSPNDVNGLNEYIIYKDGKEIANISSKENSYTVNELKSNTLYGFKVVSKYSNNEIARPKFINIRTEK